MTTTKKQQPAAQLRDGAIQATIWANHGDNGTFYSTTITRSYKTADGYKDTNSYSGIELLKLSRLAAKAYDREQELKVADRDADNGGSS